MLGEFPIHLQAAPRLKARLRSVSRDARKFCHSRGQAVIGEGVAEDDVGDVLAFDEHVGLADGVGFGVEFLAVHDEAGPGVHGGEVFPGDGEHAAGAGSGVVEGTDDAGLGEGFVVLNEDQVDHQANDFARGEVFPGGFVGEFGEFADQFFKDRPHLSIADGRRVKIDVGELFGDEVEEARFGELVDLGVELKALEDIADGRREGLNVRAEVFADVVLVAHELFHVERGRVVEVLAGFAEEEGFGVDARLLSESEFDEDSRLGRFEHTIQAAEDREGEDDLSIFGLFVVPPQQIGDGPDEGGEVGIAHFYLRPADEGQRSSKISIRLRNDSPNFEKSLRCTFVGIDDNRQKNNFPRLNGLRATDPNDFRRHPMPPL
jgi:hypothetical protein